MPGAVVVMRLNTGLHILLQHRRIEMDGVDRQALDHSSLSASIQASV